MARYVKSSILWTCFILLFVNIIPGCGNDEIDYPENIYTGCEKIMEYCSDQMPWELYLTSAPQCEAVYECTYEDYSKSCRSRLKSILNCAENMFSEDDCDGCADMVVEMQKNCPYPRDCLE